MWYTLPQVGNRCLIDKGFFSEMLSRSVGEALWPTTVEPGQLGEVEKRPNFRNFRTGTGFPIQPSDLMAFVSSVP